MAASNTESLAPWGTTGSKRVSAAELEGQARPEMLGIARVWTKPECHRGETRSRIGMERETGFVGLKLYAAIMLFRLSRIAVKLFLATLLLTSSVPGQCRGDVCGQHGFACLARGSDLPAWRRQRRLGPTARALSHRPPGLGIVRVRGRAFGYHV